MGCKKTGSSTYEVTINLTGYYKFGLPVNYRHQKKIKSFKCELLNVTLPKKLATKHKQNEDKHNTKHSLKY